MSDDKKSWDRFLKEGFLIDSEGNYRYRFPHDKMCKKFGSCYLQYIAASYIGMQDSELLNFFLTEHGISEAFFMKTILPMTNKFTAGDTDSKVNIIGAAQLLKDKKMVRRKSWPDASKHLHAEYTSSIWERVGWPGGNTGSTSTGMIFTPDDLLANDWEEATPPKQDFKITHLPIVTGTPVPNKIPAGAIHTVKKDPPKNPMGLDGAVSIG